ncbi:MAG: amidase [Deltaproteobacteria bacterium]|nr:amidase [Deltaproteobacteria bacterium]
MTALHEYDVCTLAELVRSGLLGATEILHHHLARIETAQGLGAFVHVDRARAVATARQVDRMVARGENPGPLAGVPFGVKCLEDVQGWPHTMASRALSARIASTTSTQVSRLLAAGGVPVGLTASPELGGASFTTSELHGVCRNPWRPSSTPGGSSGGSAAAVAAGLVPLATGSDSGGSLRIPAAYCGLVGFKGTYGRIPRGPGYVGLPNVRNYGAVTRTVGDTARFLDVTAGAHPSDPLSLPRPATSFEARLEAIELPRLRTRWSSGLGFTVCEAEVAQHVETAARGLCRSIGVDFHHEPVELPATDSAWRTLATPDVLALFGPLMPAAADEVGPFVRALLSAAEGLRARDFADAGLLRARLDTALAGVFDTCDVLLLPCVACPAFPAEGPAPTHIDGQAVDLLASVGLTYVFNLSGHPAASVPIAPMNGMPMGLQIVGRRHEDATVLAVAHAWERTNPWPATAPDTAWAKV